MRITVELSESELEEVCAATGENKKGPAVRKLVTDALMLRRRREIMQKFMTGEWSVEFEGWEEGHARDRAKEEERIRLWQE